MYNHMRVINPNLTDLTPFPLETGREQAAGSLFVAGMI